jgi:2-polyprenyl-3-methyl-5-hydroxy-6-metoxy-1,4-benzoquinol methylase
MNGVAITAAACPICGRDAQRLFQRGGYWVRDCPRCRHRFAEITPQSDHVHTVYDDAYFFGGGAGYADYLCERELLIRCGRQYGTLVRSFTSPGRVLDVGAAAGFVLEGLRASGWEPFGLEPNAHLAEYARKTFGLAVQEGTLEDLRSSDQYDLVSMVQVVAHFHDVRRAFEVAASVTRDAGYWLIETWDHRSWTARAFGRYWHEYSPPSVLQWFSPESLTALAKQFGLRVVARGRPRKLLQGQHAKSLLQHKLRRSQVGHLLSRLVNVAVPNRLTIPYPADDLFWLLLQKC